MLRSAFAVIAGTLVIGCGSTVTEGGPSPPTGVTRHYAIRNLQLGLTRRDGVADPAAWKQYGYDLDGRNTTRDDSKASTNSCKRHAGSPTNVLADGNDGRDNNFGQHFMSVIKSLKADVEESVNAGIGNGKVTLLLRLENVTSARDNPKVPGAVMLAGPLGAAPRWDGGDPWPMDSSSVDGGNQPLITFPNGYIANGYWVSGDFGLKSADLPLPLGERVVVPINSLVISFKVADGSDGTIAGASPPERLVEGLTPLLKRWEICPGNASFDQVVLTATTAVDLVSGAPQLQDTARECDSLSIALGFTAAPVAPPTEVVTPPAAVPDLCGG